LLVVSGTTLSLVGTPFSLNDIYDAGLIETAKNGMSDAVERLVLTTEDENVSIKILLSTGGGFGSYAGKLADSTEFKPLSRLPEASYFGSSAISRDNPRFTIVIPATETRRLFTLQGRIIRQVGRQQNPYVYILERIGDDANGKINLFHRLVLERQ